MRGIEICREEASALSESIFENFEEVKKLCQEVMHTVQTEKVDHVCQFQLYACIVSKGELQDIPDKLMAV